jgi:hypothetical protein
VPAGAVSGDVPGTVVTDEINSPPAPSSAGIELEVVVDGSGPAVTGSVPAVMSAPPAGVVVVVGTAVSATTLIRIMKLRPVSSGSHDPVVPPSVDERAVKLGCGFTFVIGVLTVVRQVR